jgi:N-acetylmuramoyl-L-alanine amidase
VRPPSSEQSSPSRDLGAATGQPHAVRVVVLDPGHGGSDKGVVSSGGVTEKDVVLAIAKRTKDLLSSSGFDARLTREDDRFVSPEARTRVANAGKADVFLSVHANGWFDADLSGFTVEVAKTPPGAESGEGAVQKWGGEDPVTSHDSELLAEILSRKLSEAVKKAGRGVRSADWAPLAGATMPAVLVEVGFLTNEGEAKKLTDSDYQGRLAKAIADAVRDYRDALAQGGQAGAGAPGGGAR